MKQLSEKDRRSVVLLVEGLLSDVVVDGCRSVLFVVVYHFDVTVIHVAGPIAGLYHHLLLVPISLISLR